MFNKKMKKIAAIVLAFVLVFALAGCGTKVADQGKDTETTAAPKTTEKSAVTTGAAKETKLDAIKKAGKIVVGTSADYAPYEFHKIIDGKDQIVGFDISIAKEIAKSLGVELSIVDMGFDGLLAALQAGKVDFVIAGMTPNEDRKKSVDFTKIYYLASQGVLVRAEDVAKYKTIEDLKGKKVGVQKGTVQADIAEEQMKDKGVEIKMLGKIPNLILELKNKKVDALVVELPVATGYVSKNPDLAVSEIKVEEDEGGSAIAVAKGNPELVAEMDKILDKLISEKTIDKFVAEANELNETE